MSWTVELTAGARRALRKLPTEPQTRTVQALVALAADPLNAANVKRLSGRDEMRLRVGDYRVLYLLEHDRLLVLVIDIGHRREVYR